MTLLSLVNDALSEIALDTVQSVISTSNPRSPAAFAVAKAALAAVSREHNWPYLFSTAPTTFPTVVAQKEYALPADFDRIITDTMYDSTDDYKMVGGVSPAEWQWVDINGGLMDGTRFMVSGYGTGRKIVLTPAPDSVNTIAYFYKSSYLAVSSSGDAKATYDADDDVSKVPEDLVRMEFKWRYLKQRGLDYGEEFREAKEAADRAYAQSKNSPTITLAGGRMSSMYPLTEGHVRDTNFGS